MRLMCQRGVLAILCLQHARCIGLLLALAEGERCLGAGAESIAGCQ